MTAYTREEMRTVLADKHPLSEPETLRALFDSIASSVMTPSEPTDWEAEDTSFTIQAALEELASRITTVEGLVGSITGLTYTPDDPTDWSPAPTLLQDAVDQLADRVNTLEP